MDREFEIMVTDNTNLMILPHWVNIPIHAITPDEALGLKEELLPPFVMRVWNRLISQNFCGKSAIITQKDVIEALLLFCDGRQEIFDKGYLEIEEIYKKAGWKVVYDKPGFNETYEATFEFTAK
jgi:hypothetical protein